MGYQMNDTNTTSDANFIAGERHTEYHDFNAGDVPNTSGDIYEVFGRGTFGFNAAGAVDHDWTIVFNFAGMLLASSLFVET